MVSAADAVMDVSVKAVAAMHVLSVSFMVPPGFFVSLKRRKEQCFR